MNLSPLVTYPTSNGLRVLSLFSGVGTFDHGFHRAGWRTVGLCEFDGKAREVLGARFPGVPIAHDVRELHGMTFGPAECVMFGSPCQDLSVAGKRAGLDGERSGLFHHAIRIIQEMRHDTSRTADERGTPGSGHPLGRSDSHADAFPRFGLWENVVGALSSNGGHDFRAVLSAFLGRDVPMPKFGRWAKCGVVRAGGREVAWRVLDSQFFGVPQRRRRIFVVCDFGGQRAHEVLLEPEGVHGDSQASRGTRAGAAVPAPLGAGNSGGAGVEPPVWQCNGSNVGPLGTLRAGNGHTTGGVPFLPVVFHPTQTPISSTNVCHSIGAGGMAPAAVAFEAQPVFYESGRGWFREGFGVLRAATGGGTLNAHLVVRPEGEPDPARPVLATASGIANTLTTMMNGQGTGLGTPRGDGSDNLVVQGVALAFAMRGREGVNTPEVHKDGSLVGGLRAAAGGSTRDLVAHAAPPSYVVRRLTPTECERLQGMPDGWTDVGGMADSHRYRMMGNGGTSFVLEWIARRMTLVLQN